jgi:hypothetical protein
VLFTADLRTFSERLVKTETTTTKVKTKTKEETVTEVTVEKSKLKRAKIERDGGNALMDVSISLAERVKRRKRS